MEMELAPPPLRVFCSYSSKDETFREELETHLSLLRREGVIDTWHFRKILPGVEWEAEISTRLEQADLILLLVSSDFIASDYCYDVEMRRAMEKHEEGTSRVVPIVIRPSDWQRTPFGKLQALPDDAVPVIEWPNRDRAWLSVVGGIRAILDEPRDPNRELRAPANTIVAEAPVTSASEPDGPDAELIVRKAAEAGNLTAANALGVALDDRGQTAEAEKWSPRGCRGRGLRRGQ